MFRTHTPRHMARFAPKYGGRMYCARLNVIVWNNDDDDDDDSCNMEERTR
jgi:hypothetical protein